MTMKAKLQNRQQNKRFTLVEHERRFKRTREQVLQLKYSRGVLQQRYNKAKH